MEPPEFMERLAALVPRPRLHSIRFHCVLATNAKLRSKGVRPGRARRNSYSTQLCLTGSARWRYISAQKKGG
jgi:hypothetical protein